MQDRRKQQGATMSFTIKKEVNVGTMIAIGTVLLAVAGWYFDTKSMKGDVDTLKVKYEILEKNQLNNWNLLDRRLVRIETSLGINPDLRFSNPKLGIQNKQ